MKNNFDKVWRWMIDRKWEVPYVNNPKDPGLETKWGISRKYNPEISPEDWAYFSVDKAKAIAYNKYWMSCNCDSLPHPFDVYVFDCGFNQGVDVARRLYTLARSPEDFLMKRVARYTVTKNKDIFLKGWVNRVVDLYLTFGGSEDGSS